MKQTTIYLSVANGKDNLTLDGNLYLFNELLAVINNVTSGRSREIARTPVDDHVGSGITTPDDIEPTKQGLITVAEPSARDHDAADKKTFEKENRT